MLGHLPQLPDILTEAGSLCLISFIFFPYHEITFQIHRFLPQGMWMPTLSTSTYCNKKMLLFDWDLPLDSSTLYYKEEHKSHLFTFSIPLNFINLCHVTLSFLCQLKYLSPFSHSWQSLLAFSVEAVRHRPKLSCPSGYTIPVNFSSLNSHSFVLLGAHGQL